MSERQALLTVHHALKKCFRGVEEQQEDWSKTIPAFKPLLSSLSNLAEQLQTCQKVAFECTPLGGFPDLQQRLTYKLISAMEEVLKKVGEKMTDLQKVRDAVSQQVAAVFHIYMQQAEEVGILASLERSAVCPSLADMLEWLQDIERHYRNDYLRRKLLLQVRYDNLPEIQGLPGVWNSLSEHRQQDLVHDTLLKVSFFLEDG
ncbi:uncharacterized protein C1orf109 homolog [Rhinatrema bivittatum]|uniref:uncharacterized protein C1orf109 homolog n=1 Tax=Rhinatrema bivittatum TaxID=194408 RepID=UPI00112D177E|nr:uncharacterized protein C1orf109 homolog [Rhinatrema bivittatum]XP_029427522.1 uncharacterized protein C1orf109 homolog [Rhinatrema bivittatum]XP_029427524.1 uncharacterized protein C1orf109 homolog [Rhinatrema bivittatum]